MTLQMSDGLLLWYVYLFVMKILNTKESTDDMMPHHILYNISLLSNTTCWSFVFALNPIM